MARQLLAVAGKRRGPASAKKIGRQGATKLNNAANKSMQNDSARIARTLLQNALKGNLASLRYLVELAQGSEEETAAGKARLVHSMASDLAEEPQWQDESTEAKAETGNNGREPEG